MSVRTMARVWADSKHGGTELLMMLAISDFADDEGRAYPSVQTLATKCRTSARQANRLISSLRQSGELEIRMNEGPRGTNLYRIVLEGMTSASPLTSTSPRHPRPEPLTSMSSPPDMGVLKPLTSTSDEPSRNHHRTIKEPPIGKALTLIDRFPEYLTGVDPQVMQDWKALRDKKKAPITKTVLDGIAREAAQARLSMNDALSMCCARGWQGFKAEWVVGRSTPQKQDARAATTAGLTGANYANRNSSVIDI